MPAQTKRRPFSSWLHTLDRAFHNDTVSALGRAYDQFSDQGIRNLFTLNWEALGSGLTSFGGLQPATESLCASVTDVLGFVLGWRVQGWCQIRLDLASDSRVMVRVVEAHARYPLGITYSSDCSGCTTPYLWWSSWQLRLRLSQARCSFTNRQERRASEFMTHAPLWCSYRDEWH